MGLVGLPPERQDRVVFEEQNRVVDFASSPLLEQPLLPSPSLAIADPPEPLRDDRRCRSHGATIAKAKWRTAHRCLPAHMTIGRRRYPFRRGYGAPRSRDHPDEEQHRTPGADAKPNPYPEDRRCDADRAACVRRRDRARRRVVEPGQRLRHARLDPRPGPPPARRARHRARLGRPDDRARGDRRSRHGRGGGRSVAQDRAHVHGHGPPRRCDPPDHRALRQADARVRRQR